MKRLRVLPLAAALALIASGTLFCEDPLGWLNAARRTAHVPEVQADALLSLTAERYAGQLASRGILSHRGDDGSTGLDRYRAEGGTEIRVGEILGAGPADGLIERAWMASPEHRQIAMGPDWTHAGWGSARVGQSLVMVMMFTRKLVDGLVLGQEGPVVSTSGRFLPVDAASAVLFNGLQEVTAAAWDRGSRAFRFELARAGLEGYLRLGYRTPDGTFILTNTFHPPLSH